MIKMAFSTLPILVKIFSIATIIGQVILISYLGLNTLEVITGRKIRFLKIVNRIGVEYGLFMGFLIALTATSGSLYLSEILGWNPCRLCWFQRVLIYPLTVIFGVGLLKKDRRAFDYAIILVLLGLLVSSYHYYVQMNDATTSCGITSESCSNKYVLALGYLTIPLIAFSCFASILILTLLNRGQDYKKILSKRVRIRLT